MPVGPVGVRKRVAAAGSGTSRMSSCLWLLWKQIFKKFCKHTCCNKLVQQASTAKNCACSIPCNTCGWWQKATPVGFPTISSSKGRQSCLCLCLIENLCFGLPVALSVHRK